MFATNDWQILARAHKERVDELYLARCPCHTERAHPNVRCLYPRLLCKCHRCTPQASEPKIERNMERPSHKPWSQDTLRRWCEWLWSLPASNLAPAKWKNHDIGFNQLKSVLSLRWANDGPIGVSFQGWACDPFRFLTVQHRPSTRFRTTAHVCRRPRCHISSMATWDQEMGSNKPWMHGNAYSSTSALFNWSSSKAHGGRPPNIQLKCSTCSYYFILMSVSAETWFQILKTRKSPK